MTRVAPSDPAVAAVHADVLTRCGELFRRAQQAGVLRADVDLEWARRVYYALVDEAGCGRSDPDVDPDALATTIVDTLLHGVGADTSRL